MKTSAFFIACISLVLSLIASRAQAQILAPQRGEPKIPDWVQTPGFQDAAKSSQEAMEAIRKSSVGIPKEPLIPRLELKPPTLGAPARQYSPRTRPQTAGAATPPTQALAPPMAQPAMPERRPQSAPAAPAKPPCVYKPVMSDEEINACR